MDIGDPVEVAKKYYEEGIDELVFYDITATHEKRKIMIDVAEKVAEQISIPFSVGGGLRTVEECYEVILAGADKVHINSAAVVNPNLITDVANRLGSKCVVLSMDVLNVEKTEVIPSGFEIVINGGRKNTGIDAIEWAINGVELEAGEIVVNSIDADGTKEGFNIPLMKKVFEAVKVPVIASGGGGSPQHVYEVLTKGGADAALVSSILHYNEYTIKEIKDYLYNKGIEAGR